MKLTHFRKIMCLIFGFVYEVVISILAFNIIGNQLNFDNGGQSPLCEECVIATFQYL
jgi:hypothetical protein